tara:strand:- start:45 stop:257 length:213 start_codon:yes stop_codon:yes gene_type:complete
LVLVGLEIKVVDLPLHPHGLLIVVKVELQPNLIGAVIGPLTVWVVDTVVVIKDQKVLLVEMVVLVVAAVI